MISKAIAATLLTCALSATALAQESGDTTSDLTEGLEVELMDNDEANDTRGELVRKYRYRCKGWACKYVPEYLMQRARYTDPKTGQTRYYYRNH